MRMTVVDYDIAKLSCMPSVAISNSRSEVYDYAFINKDTLSRSRILIQNPASTLHIYRSTPCPSSTSQRIRSLVTAPVAIGPMSQ